MTTRAAIPAGGKTLALDLSPSLERAAKTDRTFLYRLDDTHWTPHGPQVAVAAIVDFLRQSR